MTTQWIQIEGAGGGLEAGRGPEIDWTGRLDALRALLRELGSVVVAYSGGVDSSLVLRVAHEVLGSSAIGVIIIRLARTFTEKVERIESGVRYSQLSPLHDTTADLKALTARYGLTGLAHHDPPRFDDD